MNTRQKVALSVLAPLFIMSVGHTIINRKNTKFETENLEVPDSTRMNDSLRIQGTILPAQFKAEQNLDKQKIDSINKYIFLD